MAEMDGQQQPGTPIWCGMMNFKDRHDSWPLLSMNYVGKVCEGQA